MLNVELIFVTFQFVLIDATYILKTNNLFATI